ncbi:restriction endonuclease subunit S [Streptomyces sp. NPDC059456]|uniref:restriction endonuclease subunit S n=1 Tax=Streptomyces sp. NPDC059456 TaxID=3346838 RepID=UPI00368D3722
MTWPAVPLGEISTIYDGPHATPVKCAEGPWFLSISSLENGRLKLSESAHLSESDFAQWTRRVTPEQGDLLFSYETKLGAAALMPAKVQACLGRRMGLLRPLRDKVVPEFLLYAYLGPDFQAEIKARSIHGATVDRIPLGSLGTWPISLPPLKDQQAIAELLGALDNKIAANERQLITLNELCSAWHERIVNLGDADTSTCTLAELAKHGFMTLGDGYRTKQSEHGEPGLPILRVADVGHGAITPSFTHYVSNAYRGAMGPKVSQKGDVVLTTKGTVGRVALIEAGHPEFVYSPQVCYFRLTESSPVSPLFMLHWFQGKEFWSQAGGLKGQTDMADYLSLRDIRALRITIPSVSDLSEFSRVCNPMQKRSEAARRENHILMALRDTLLPQLVTGKIRVKDAERIVEDAA